MQYITKLELCVCPDYIIGGGDVPTQWSFGWETGKNNDLICVKPKVVGELALPDNEGSGWIPVELAQSIVLIANRQYWITFELRGVEFAVCIAAEGKKLKLRWSTFGDTWLPYEPQHRYILKFFGRVLPTTSNLALASVA